jgi:hypothetical protein
MLDLFGNTTNPRASLAESRASNRREQGTRDTLRGGMRDYVGDESWINRCRELNSSIVSERLSHGPLHRPQSS